MKNIVKITGLIVLFYAQSALAITPEDGWWWNPAQSGTGYNIETQNGTVFIATFVYDEAGAPIWYSGSGKLENSRATIALMRSDGGQCIGCPYQAPLTSTGIEHPITINFTSPMEGAITWQGQDTTSIERFNFGTGNGLAQLLGEWVFITKEPSDFGDYEGDRITFSRIEDGLAEGSKTNVPYKFAFARYIGQRGDYTYVAINYRSKSLNTAYAFRFVGINKIEGVQELVFSDETSDEIWTDLMRYGVPFEAYRVR